MPEGSETGPRAIFFGHARLPQSLCPPNGAGVLTIELEVVEGDGTVEAVFVSGFPTMAGDLLSSLLCGRKLGEAVPHALDELATHYVGPPQKALCTAVQSAFDSYKRWARTHRHGTPESGRQEP